MKTIVCFSCGGISYGLPVGATRSVGRTTGMIALPAARPDVAGLIPGDPPMTVISPLGTGGGFVVVVEVGEHSFALQVDAVSGLRRVDDADIRPAPSGQERSLVSGVVETGGELIMLIDPAALETRL